jgi:hypothetical protein
MSDLAFFYKKAKWFHRIYAGWEDKNLQHSQFLIEIHNQHLI